MFVLALPKDNGIDPHFFSGLKSALKTLRRIADVRLSILFIGKKIFKLTETLT